MQLCIKISAVTETFKQQHWHVTKQTTMGSSMLLLSYSSMLQKLAQSAWIDSSLLPTFTYTAQFTLRNIFMFDGKFYYLNSRCRSYLLAGDLIHNSFSLAAVYNGQVCYHSLKGWDRKGVSVPLRLDPKVGSLVLVC